MPDESQLQFRATYRVVIEQDAYNISAVSTPVSGFTQAASLVGRWNQSANETELFGLDGRNFFLVNQSYTPMESKGSKFFRGRKEWVSVSAWTDFDWSD